MKYLIILIMACSLYPQDTIYNNTTYFNPDSLKVLKTKYGLKITPICETGSGDWTISNKMWHWTAWTEPYNAEDDPDNLWYNYNTGKIDYRESFTDEVAGWLILQTPHYLKIYKWLREKGYDPMESVRKTNTFADKEHEEFEKRINKIMED